MKLSREQLQELAREGKVVSFPLTEQYPETKEAPEPVIVNLETARIKNLTVERDARGLIETVTVNYE